MTRWRRLTATVESGGAVAEETEDIAYFWVETQESLVEVLVKALKASRVALDTEFHRERTYWPKVALLQLKINDEIFLIDPLAVPDLLSISA